MDKDIILSPSSINLFIEDQTLWVLKHFFKQYGNTNIYAVRGKLAEELANLSLDEEQPLSYSEYLPHAIRKSLFDNVEITDEDYLDFYSWGCKCHSILKGYRVVSMQDRLAGELFGMKVAGYIDYKINIVRDYSYLDLKTVSKVPNLLVRGERAGRLPATKKANVRQQVIYRELSGINTALLFVDADGNSLHYDIQQADVDEYLPEIEAAINKIKKYLTIPLENVILATRPEKMNSFFWDDTLRAKAKEVYKL